MPDLHPGDVYLYAHGDGAIQLASWDGDDDYRRDEVLISFADVFERAHSPLLPSLAEACANAKIRRRVGPQTW